MMLSLLLHVALLREANLFQGVGSRSSAAQLLDTLAP
jgi:hypothetical protein